MERPRVQSWEAPLPGQSIKTLSGILEKYIDKLVTANVNVYSSTDFTKGYDHELIVQHADLCADLMALDPRGGIFKQNMMYAAYVQTVTTANQMDKFKDLITHTECGLNMFSTCVRSICGA